MSVPAATTKEVAKSPVSRLKDVLASPTVAEQFKNCMADNSSLFVASLIDVYASDAYLQKCDPKLVVMEALKAATLKLPINKSLGFAYIVPYDKSKKVGKDWVKESIPTFQIGYRGYIQLAMRTGAYKYINADVIYDGELVKIDKRTGDLDLTGDRRSDEVVGYFAYIETVNGFRKSIYGTKGDIEAHATRYSKSFASDKSTWKTNFDEMAVKTMIRQLLGKYGIMSVEMATAMNSDNDELTPDGRLQDDLTANANQDPPIDITPTPTPKTENGVTELPLQNDSAKEECPV